MQRTTGRTEAGPLVNGANLRLTPLVATASRCVADALDVRSRARVQLSGSLDRFFLSRLDGARPVGAWSTDCVITLGSTLNVDLLVCHVDRLHGASASVWVC